MKKIFTTIIAVFSITLFLFSIQLYGQTNKTKNLPNGFIENKGQITDQNHHPNQQVKYLLNMVDVNIQLKTNSFSYDTYVSNENGTITFHRVDVELVGANTNPQIITKNKSEDYINYYTAGTTEQGILFAYHYKDIIYQNIYNGIDLHFKANATIDKPVEYDFIVHPGADASQIKLNYIGAIDKNLVDGKVVLKLAHGNLSESIPASYLFENNQALSVNYTLENNLIAFHIPNYDKSKTLIIDPNPDRDWGTFYGGTGTDYFNDLTADASANIFAVGSANSTNLIATTGAHQTTHGGGGYDAMIVKFNTSGVRQWATYYGGTGADYGSAIALDASANIYAFGKTESTTNISTTGAYQTALSGGTNYDAFLVKFNTSGVRQFGTYFGGTANEEGNAIAVNGTSIYFGGKTISTTGVASTGAYLTTLSGGAYLAKFSTAGVRQWSTYYQASNLYAVTVDAGGNPIFGGNVTSAITGVTTAGSHQTTYGGGANDGFIAKFSAAGARTWSTYYGGTDNDYVYSIKTNSTNNIFFGGTTASTTGIAANTFSGSSFNGGTSDGFVANFNSSGVRQWGSYIGTSAVDQIYGIEVRSDNSIYFSGATNGSIGITGAYQPTSGGGYDLFFGKIDPIIANYPSSNHILWITNYGSTASETFGGFVTTGTALNTKLFIGGGTTSTNLLSSIGAHQTTSGGSSDGFLARFAECGIPGRTGLINTPAGPFCAGSTYTFSVPAAYNASSYQWSLPSGWSGTSTTNSITVTASTISGFITVRGVNTCANGAYAPSVNLVVLSPPTATPVVSGASPVCIGSTPTYTCNPVSGATSYTWQLPTGWSGTSTTNSITPTVGGSAGIFLVSAAGTNACGTGPFSSSSLNVPVLTVPPQPGMISGSAVVCAGNTRTYSVPNMAPGTYNWTLPSGWTGSSTTNSISTTVGALSGNISVRATNSCGMSIAQTLAVTSSSSVLTMPGSITGNTTVCTGSSQTYSISPIAGATQYTWSLPSGWTGSSTSNSITITPSTASGTVYVEAINGCGPSPAQSMFVTVNTIPAQPSAITGSAFVCSGSSQTYSVTNVPGVTYAWTFPSGWTGSSTSNSITVTPSAIGGTITVVPSNACGTGLGMSLGVSASNIPAQPTIQIAPTTVCSGTSQSYLVLNDFAANNWTWTLPSGWSGSSVFNSINLTVGTTSGNIVVTANNTCGSSTSLIIPVTVNTIPSQPSVITGSGTVCQGTSQTYSIANVSGVTYNWTLPSGWSGNSTTNSITSTVGATSGNITVTATNSCGTSTTRSLAVTVNTIPTQPGVVIGSGTVCQGTSQTYSVTNIGGVTYNWSLPVGWSGSSTTNIINATTATNSGNITVFASNACGSSLSSSITVNVTLNPSQPSVITGNTNVCQTTSQTYSVINVSGITYNWTLPSGWLGSSSTNSINTTVGATSGSVLVTASNSCSTSTVRILSVTVNSTPLIPAAITGNTNTCQGTTQSYAVTNVSGVTYSWTASNGIVSGSGNNINVTWNTIGTQTLSISATNMCGTSSLRTLIVNVNSGTALSQPTAISGNTAVCVGTSQIYSVSTVSGATSYGWSIPGTWVGTSVTNTISVQIGSSSGLVSVAANNSCGSSTSQTLNVNVSNIPVSPVQIFGSSIICSGTNQTYSVSAVANASSYNWNFPSGWSGSSSSNIISSVVGSTSGNISISAQNSCGTSASETLSVTVNTIPSTPLSIIGNVNLCSSTSVTYSVASVLGATNYNWFIPAGSSGNSSSNSINLNIGSTGGILAVNASNICGTSLSQSVTLNVTTVNNLVTVNSNTLSSDQSSANYQWLDCSNNFSQLSGQNSQIFVPQNSGSYAVEVSLNGCTDTSICHNFIVTSLANLKSDITEVTIFPNPNDGLFNIKVTNPYFTDLLLEINNSLGQTVFSENYKVLDKFNQEIDLKNFPKGIYFVSISTNQERIIKKVTVK